MAGPYDYIPDDIKKEAAADSEGKQKKTAKPGSAAGGKGKEPKITGEEKPQRRILFKKKRAGTVLSRDEVKAIKAGRKKLRKEMKARGIKSKQEFELTAASLGLYFDNNHSFWLWLWRHWLGALIGMLIATLLILFIFSLVQQLRGHFTVNLSDGMFKEGFTLADNKDFDNATVHLFANPAQDVPCISINQIPTNIDEIDGEHNDLYFAYTYYIRNEGENNVGYTWNLNISAETLNVADAVWAMVFEDGRMRFYAKANPVTGQKEALPAFDDDTRGYINLPIKNLAPDSDQFEIVKQDGQITYWRVIPDQFLSSTCITNGVQTDVEPMEAHKYTVVLWLEGDDMEANDSVIGGHLGVEMNFRLVGEYEEEDDEGNSGDKDGTTGRKWKKFWDSIWGGLND